MHESSCNHVEILKFCNRIRQNWLFLSIDQISFKYIQVFLKLHFPKIKFKKIYFIKTLSAIFIQNI